MTKFHQINPADSKKLEDLATPIWREHYTPIIGEEQVSYMLAKFQSAEAITNQIKEGMEYYIVEFKGENAGYFAIQLKGESLFISKFYLSIDYRGKGIAKDMLAKIENLAKFYSAKQLELTVNKFNPAVTIYLKLGFKNVEAMVMDIGNGYIMDDYRMIKRI